MANNIEGEVIWIGEVRQITDKFRIREFVLRLPVAKEGRTPEEVPLQCAQDRCKLLDGITPGCVLSVDFDPCGRKSKQGDNRWFCTLSAWRVSVLARPGAARDLAEEMEAAERSEPVQSEIPF